MNEHIAGEWEVIRTKSNITVAQGYKCSCGVIDCPHMQLSVPASPAIAPSSAEPTVPELRKAFIAGWNAHADDGGPKLTELFQLAEPPPSSAEPQAEVAGAPPTEGQELCEDQCNPYVAKCGAKFCSDEARRFHNRACQRPSASEPTPAPISLVRQRVADFSEGYRAGFNGAENGEADDIETAWALSKASLELADAPSAPASADVLAVAEELEELAMNLSNGWVVQVGAAPLFEKAAALLRSTGSREAT